MTAKHRSTNNEHCKQLVALSSLSTLPSLQDGDDDNHTPLLQRIGNEDDDSDDSSSTESDQGSEKSHQDYHRREALDAIEEAWDASDDSLNLRLLHLDRFAVALLLQKWDKLCLLRHREQQLLQETNDLLEDSCRGKNMNGSGGAAHGCVAETPPNSKKTIRKINLDRCTFTGGFAVQLMVIFLNKVGNELMELSITDGHIQNIITPQGQSPLWTLLGGVKNLRFLECLTLERVDLRGKLTGYFLRCILQNNPDLQVLQLYGCHIDDEMYNELLDGLKCQFELRHLDVGGLNLDDDQLGRLVDALVHEGAHRKLQLLDISGSSIGVHSLKSLSSLLQNCLRIEELVVCSCTCSDFLESQPTDKSLKQNPNYIDSTDSSCTPSAQHAYEDFVKAVDSVISFKNQSLRLSYCDVTSPLFRALESHTKLKVTQHAETEDTYEAIPTSDNSHQRGIHGQPQPDQSKQSKTSEHQLTTEHGNTRSTVEDGFFFTDSYIDSCVAMMICT